MRTVEQFIEAAATGKPPAESEMALAAQRAEKALDAEQMKLIKKIRVRDGQVVLAEGSEAVQEAVLKVEAVDHAIRDDIRGYLDALGDYGSVTQLTETLARHRRTMANVQRDYDNIVKQLVNKHIEQPQDHPDAQAAADKRDRVVQELKPVCDQLQSRINKVKEILGRYY